MTHPRWFAYTAVSLLVPALMEGAEPLPDGEFLKVAMTGGSVEGGKLIFTDQRTACSQCHSVDGTASGIGPDLYAAGDKFARADLAQSILDPSSSIMTGYATTILENRKGERFQGILRSRADEVLVLGQVGGVDLRIARSEVVKEETGAVSLMPPGLHSQLSPAEFRDLIAYLESLRQPETKVVQEAGTPLEIPVLSQQVAFEPVFGMKEKFHKPVWFGGHPTVQGGYLIAEKSKGTISLLERVDGEEVISPFVNILDEIYVANDEGLLGVALHPGFAENGRYFMMHETMTGQQRGMAVVERVASADRRKDSGNPTRSILRWNIDTLFHHGGGLEFGPDGFLYIGMGDGGPQEDPEGKAQDLSRFEGSLLRIDVDREEEGRAYGIPGDNPFVTGDSKERRPEIFAYGLRQPWRFSFDPANGDLWVGDVGQNRFEEVCIVRSGENHGWNIQEGFSLFSTQYRTESAEYTPPVVAFLRKHGVSVTGGYVMRTDPQSSFHGVYICADYQSKKVWGITQRDRKLKVIRQIGTAPDRIVSFGRDPAGELYAVGYSKGVVYRVDLDEAKFE
ncbi:MAG: PQQ-dependent sugar dehydrogenase [Roseibacillus sp.]|nr:PQQ-dependent sugar dehydrogenase [Roseibacillus sp.]